MSEEETNKEATKKVARKRVAKKAAKKTAAVKEQVNLAKFNWREKIPKECLGIQDYYLREKGIEINKITADEWDELKESTPDEFMFITLAGLSNLAHQRGLKSVEYSLPRIEDGYVVARCRVEFSDATVDGVDFPAQSFEGVANATDKNTEYPFNMFLESLAENRAFARACRRAFNIHIVASEELQVESNKSINKDFLGDDAELTAQDSLKQMLSAKGKSFTDLKSSLLNKGWDGVDKWDSFEEIPSEQALLIISKIIDSGK